MIKAKHNIYVIIILTLFVVLVSQEYSGFLPNQSSHNSGDFSLRYLKEDRNSNKDYLFAKIYLGCEFNGDSYDVLTGSSVWFNYNGKISFRVGKATLRIVDWQNSIVYKYEASTDVREFRITSSNWSATIGPPRLENCVMLFEKNDYSGYFNKVCLSEGVEDWVRGFLFDNSYTSFTLPQDKSVSNVIFLSGKSNLEKFTKDGSFCEDMNYVYLFGEIPLSNAYAFVAKTEEFLAIVSGESTKIPKGRLLLVAGENSYAKIIGEYTKISFSGDNQFVLIRTDEETIGNARDLFKNPGDGCIIVYDDEDGFANKQTVCLEGSITPFRDTLCGYIVLPFLGISEVLLSYRLPDDKAKEIRIVSDGRVPKTKDAKFYCLTLIPELDQGLSYFYKDSNIFASEPFAITDQLIFSEENPISSIQVGRDVENLYLLTNDKLQEVTVYKAGDLVQMDSPLTGVTSYFNKQNIFDTIIYPNCARLYFTCDFVNDSFTNFIMLCEGEDTNFIELDISNVKYIAIPKNHGYNSILIYKEETYDKQFTLTESTCLNANLGKDQRVTIIPIVPSEVVYIYSLPFYTGIRTSLSKEKHFANLENVKEISFVFGLEASVKIIMSRRKVVNLDYNMTKFRTHGITVTIQYGDSSLENNTDDAFWTFDDRSYNNMRIFHGCNFFDEQVVSYRAKYLAFPKTGAVFRAILIDRKNSLIQTYDNSPGLIPIDHTTFGGIDRVILIDETWDSVLLAEKAYFGQFKQIMSKTSLVQLVKDIKYSFVTSLKRDLRIFNWSMLDNLKVSPSLAVQTFYSAKNNIITQYAVQQSGLFSFVLGDEFPQNVLTDCIILLDAQGENCSAQSNIRRFCMRNKGIDLDTFDINTGNNNDHLLILITKNSDELKIKSKYSGINLDGGKIIETTCVAVKSHTNYQVNFEL